MRPQRPGDEVASGSAGKPARRLCSRPPGRKGPMGVRMNKRLFVGNLSWDVSESDLEQAFAPYGGTAAAIPTERDSGRSRGFGFIEVPEDQLQAAINAMNGKELGGRPLTVNEAKP